MASFFRFLFLSKVGKRKEDKQLCCGKRLWRPVTETTEQRRQRTKNNGYETKQLDILERFVKETKQNKCKEIRKGPCDVKYLLQSR
jgi:hypothetical protein